MELAESEISQIAELKGQSTSFRSCLFHGIEVFEESHTDWRKRIALRLNDNAASPCTRIHTLNPEILSHGLNNAEYMKILRSGSWNVIDGLWLSVAIWIKKGLFLSRRCGSDLVEDLLTECQASSLPFFLLGGSKERLAAACSNIRKSYPGIICEGYSPVFTPSIIPNDQEAIESRLRAARPAVLAICFGAPKQETWMQANASLLDECGVKIAAGLGGTVDFLSGQIPRAPRWMRILGFEWLFRAIKEPFRFKRYWKSIPALISND